MSGLILESGFDFRKTYFMVAGIAGVNPEVATLGSVAFARYAVQVALQYEFDPREIPANFSTGYIPLGAKAPGQYPVDIYGTEVFELNTALRSLAVSFASTAVLNDSTTAQVYRANYASASIYAAGAAPPSVVECDVATSDVYYSGNILSQAFENFTLLMTNGSGIYWYVFLALPLKDGLTSHTAQPHKKTMASSKSWSAPPQRASSTSPASSSCAQRPTSTGPIQAKQQPPTFYGPIREVSSPRS
jgi:hypothetical protein